VVVSLQVLTITTTITIIIIDVMIITIIAVTFDVLCFFLYSGLKLLCSFSLQG
jgi:hypothetical protein